VISSDLVDSSGCSGRKFFHFPKHQEFACFLGVLRIRVRSDRDQEWIRTRSGPDQTAIRITSCGPLFFPSGSHWLGTSGGGKPRNTRSTRKPGGATDATWTESRRAGIRAAARSLVKHILFLAAGGRRGTLIVRKLTGRRCARHHPTRGFRIGSRFSAVVVTHKSLSDPIQLAGW
jgi:hypothetical protein